LNSIDVEIEYYNVDPEPEISPIKSQKEVYDTLGSEIEK
jgi:hypothetical protein